MSQKQFDLVCAELDNSERRIPVLKSVKLASDGKKLPRWARKHDAVEWLCQLNRVYRNDVLECDSKRVRHFLIRKAEVTRRIFERKNPIHEIG